MKIMEILAQCNIIICYSNSCQKIPPYLCKIQFKKIVIVPEFCSSL